MSIMDGLIEQTKKLGWNQQLVSLEVAPEVVETSKLLLVGKILSSKLFSSIIVKEIILKY